MEAQTFARLEKRLHQAKKAIEISPEDEEFQQEYESAKAALKLTQKEAWEI